MFDRKYTVQYRSVHGYWSNYGRFFFLFSAASKAGKLAANPDSVRHWRVCAGEEVLLLLKRTVPLPNPLSFVMPTSNIDPNDRQEVADLMRRVLLPEL